MEIHGIINFGLSCIIAAFSFLLFYTVIYYKKYRLKNEALFAEIFLYQGIVFGIYILKTIFFFVGEEKTEEIDNNERSIIELIKMYIFTFQHYLYNWSVAIIIITRLFYNIELYITFQQPIEIAKYLLPLGQKKIFYEILAVCLSILYVVLEFVLFGQQTISSLYEEKTQKKDIPFFISFKLSPILCIILTISLIILLKRLSLTKHFITKGTKRIYFLIIKDLIILILELFFVSIQVIFVFVPSQLQSNYVYYVMISYITIGIYGFEYLVELIGFSKSTFCVSMVRESIFGSIALLFNRDIQKEMKKELASLSDQSGKCAVNYDGPNANLITNNINKEEDLFSILDNKREEIYIEEYLFDYSEAIITILLSSMLKVFNSQIFNQIHENFFLDFSSSEMVTKKDKVIPIIDVFPSQENGFNEAYDFEFVKNKDINHFNEFSEIFELAGISNSNFKVKITSFFTEDIIGNISSKNIIVDNMKHSLFSHLNKESFSLLKINMKDATYLNSKTFTLKTNDKQYFLEIKYLNGKSKLTKEKNSESNTKVSSNWKNKIKKYSTYIKTNSNSFLPTLIGVFTIQINKLTPMLIFISKNSLYESIPKSNLKYWQLVRFDKFKRKRIASSKETNDVINLNNFCVENEENEEIELDKEKKNKNVTNPNNSNKVNSQIIMLKNLNEFSETLKEDVNTLQSLHLLNNLALLMMYYELGQNKKVDKIDDVIANVSQDGITGTNEMGVVKGNEFDFLNSYEFTNTNQFIHQNSQNLSNFSGKMVINGYEGQYDEFKCVCFFMFDNVFLHDNKEKVELSWKASNFCNKIISYFSKFN